VIRELWKEPEFRFGFKLLIVFVVLAFGVGACNGYMKVRAFDGDWDCLWIECRKIQMDGRWTLEKGNFE
jgi:hypothetical protein